MADDEIGPHSEGRAPGRKKSGLHDATLAFRPEDIVDFIELAPFTRRWAKLGLDDEDDLLQLQLSIMDDPKAAPVIRGTSGLRKLRFAPTRWKVGKSGAVRVLYTHFEEFGVVLLCLVYGKNEAGNISDAVKLQLNKQIAEAERELQRRARLK